MKRGKEETRKIVKEIGRWELRRANEERTSKEGKEEMRRRGGDKERKR